MAVHVPPSIHPELARAASLQPDLDYADAAAARAGLARAVKLSRALSPVQDPAGGVLVREDRVPTRAGPDGLAVRIYRPLTRDDALPALVYFHGGGFVAGDLDTDHPRCARLASEGCVVVVSVDYPLAPECPFPAAFHGCHDALLWVHARSADLGIDPALVGVGGNSAGAALAACVALAARDAGSPRLALLMLLYPVADDRLETCSMREFVDTPGWNGRNSRHMWRHYLGPLWGETDVPPYAAPARALDLSGLPFTFVMTAELDPLRDEARQLSLRLAEAGVPVRLREFAGAFHGFDAAVPTASLSAQAMNEQCALLKAGPWRTDTDQRT